MALERKSIFSLGRGDILPDPRVNEALAAAQLRQQGSAQAFAQELQRAHLENERARLQQAPALAAAETQTKLQMLDRQAKLAADDRAARFAADLQLAAQQNAAALERERLQQAGFQRREAFQAREGAADRASRESLGRAELASREKIAGVESFEAAARAKAKADQDALESGQKRRGEIVKHLAGTDEVLADIAANPETADAALAQEILAAGRSGPDFARAVATEGGVLQRARETDRERQVAATSAGKRVDQAAWFRPLDRLRTLAGVVGIAARDLGSNVGLADPLSQEPGELPYQQLARLLREAQFARQSQPVPSAELPALRAFQQQVGVPYGLDRWRNVAGVDAPEARLQRLALLAQALREQGFHLEPGAGF